MKRKMANKTKINIDTKVLIKQIFYQSKEIFEKKKLTIRYLNIVLTSSIDKAKYIKIKCEKKKLLK